MVFSTISGPLFGGSRTRGSTCFDEMQYLSDIEYLSRLWTRSSFTMLNSSTDLKEYMMLSLYLIDSRMYLVTSCLAAGTTNFRIAVSSPEAVPGSTFVRSTLCRRNPSDSPWPS